MSSEYRVLLDPAVEITSEDLAAAWAEIEECREAGQFKVVEPQKKFSLDLADAANVAFITLAANLTKDLVMELVKRALARADEKRARDEVRESIAEQVPDAETGLPLIMVRPKR